MCIGACFCSPGAFRRAASEGEGSSRMTQEDEKQDPSLDSELLLEVLDDELPNHEALDYVPTPEELREAEPAVRCWQTRAAERLRELDPPAPLDVSREELLARLAEVGALVRGLDLAYLVDAHDAETLPTQELRAHLVALEAALAVVIKP